MATWVDDLIVGGLLVAEQWWAMPARLAAPSTPQQQVAARAADPVVLVGGFANAASGWDEWRRSLTQDGFRVFVFNPTTFGLGDMDAAARDVAAFIMQVRHATGAAQVDVIGFSEGGLLLRRAAARYGAATAIDRLMSLATPHAGIRATGLLRWLARLPLLAPLIPAALSQLLAGSTMLRDIAADDAPLRATGDVRYASLFSRGSDGLVHERSAQLPGALWVPVNRDDGRDGHGPSHFGMYHQSSHAYDAARLLLLDAPDAAAQAAALTGNPVA